MKMILAIVNREDSANVATNLTKNGFFTTKLATTGGFLMAGNTTFLIGLEDEKVDTALEIIRKSSSKRQQMSPVATSSYGIGAAPSIPVEITVGGATVFVMNIERYEKM